jgi:hypothetical protein
MTSHLYNLTPNTRYTLNYYLRVDPAAPWRDQLLFSSSGLQSSPSADLTYASPPITPPGQGQFTYVVTVSTGGVTPPDVVVPVSVLGVSQVSASPASRIFPTFRATVGAVAPATGTPTGSVRFSIGGTPVCTATLDATGVATCRSSLVIDIGDQTYTAEYFGDGYFFGAIGTGNLTLL